MLRGSARRSLRGVFFQHEEGLPCTLYTDKGLVSTRAGSGFALYTKRPCAPNTGGGDGLAKYDGGVDGKQGKHLKGAGVYETDDQYATAAKADAAGCAAVCSALAHDDDCKGFAFNAQKTYSCTLYTAAGVASSRNGDGFVLYTKKSTGVPSGGGVDVFEAAVTDSKGRYEQGKGNYRNGGAQDEIKTVDACATLCNSAPHAAGRAQTAGETCNSHDKCGCYGFSFKPTTSRCELHSEFGANYNLYTATATVGWEFYKLTQSAATNPTSTTTVTSTTNKRSTTTATSTVAPPRKRRAAIREFTYTFSVPRATLGLRFRVPMNGSTLDPTQVTLRDSRPGTWSQPTQSHTLSRASAPAPSPDGAAALSIVLGAADTAAVQRKGICATMHRCFLVFSSGLASDMGGSPVAPVPDSLALRAHYGSARVARRDDSLAATAANVYDGTVCPGTWPWSGRRGAFAVWRTCLIPPALWPWRPAPNLSVCALSNQ